MRDPTVRFNVGVRIPVGEPGDDDQKRDRDAETGSDLAFDRRVCFGGFDRDSPSDLQNLLTPPGGPPAPRQTKEREG